MYGPFDKQLELRDIGDDTLTGSHTETGIAFAATMAGDFKTIIYVGELNETGSPTNTYLFTVEVDSELAFGDAPVEVGRVTVTDKGVYEIPLSGQQISQRKADAAAIRVKATLGGGTPSLNYGCYLAPVV